MPEGAAEALKAQTVALAKERERAAKNLGTQPATVKRTATHSAIPLMPTATHLGLATQLRGAFEGGSSDEDVARIIGAFLGSRGGKARAANLDDEEKSAAGRKAAAARWGPKTGETE